MEIFGDEPGARLVFRAYDTGVPVLAHMIESRELGRAIDGALAECANVVRFANTQLVDLRRVGGAMEVVLPGHQDVAECAVLGAADRLKGEVPLGFLVLKSGVNRPPLEIEKEAVQLVRDKIGHVCIATQWHWLRAKSAPDKRSERCVIERQ